MIVKSLLIILFAFLLVFVLIPLLLSSSGLDILPGGGGTGFDRGEAFLLLRSRDDGDKWDTPVFARERGDSRPAEILDVAFHPRDQKVMFAGTKSAGLWKSEDEGANWHSVKDSSSSLDQRADVYKIAMSQVRPGVMYLAAFQGNRGRVFRSEDGGSSFREIYSVSRDRVGVFDLWTPPTEPDKIVITTGEGRILASSDGGNRWRVVKTLRNPAALITMHPVFPGQGHLLTSQGEIFRTFDGAENWAELGVPRPGGSAATLRIEHPYSRVSFFQFGSSFSSSQSALDSLVIDPYNPAALWLTRGSALLSSADSGYSWREIHSLINSQGVGLGGVAAHPTRPDTILVTAGAALYTSMDRGINWSTDPFDTRYPLREIFIHPQKPETIFLTTGR